MLTLAFGVYALALLVAILVIGSLSDHIGRRPLMIAALAIDLVAMLLFLFASSVGWLIVARIVQGIATGAASSALSAAVVELAPERRKKLGALMTGMAPLAGLGIGALFAGLLAHDVFAVWLVLVVVMAAGTVFTLFTPETSTRKPGALASLVPRVSVPVQVRRLYVSALPGIIAAFMMMALFMGLVPIVLVTVFKVGDPLVGALAAFVTFAAGTIVSAVTTGVRPHGLRLAGAAAMTIGAILFVAGVGLVALPLLGAATLFGGAGLGASFAGTTRGLVPEVKPHEHAGLFAAIYLVAYLAMGGTAIIAGLFAGPVGVSAMAVGFGVVTAAVALSGVLTTAGHNNKKERTDPR